MDNFAASLIGTGVGATLAGSTAYILARYNNRIAKHRNLSDRLDSILKISLQYPYVEQEEFTESWDKEKMKGKTEEAIQYQRYDIYTNLVFNYMEELVIYHEFDSEKIKQEVDVQSWIRTHRKIWENPASELENHNGYCGGFINLINKYLSK